MLPPDRIKELSGKHLLVVGAGYVRPLDVTGFARAIEAEVRKDYDALIRQMLEALEKSNLEWKELADSGDAGYWKAEEQAHYQQSEAAITAATARLEKAP